ncbi:coiled-coil domain-containing protein mad1 [Neurospora sp. IMI 360204]|nr:coiled-coil domain-containing protein mad1 [Neurospora sp. IMI 360204]
MPPSSIPQPGQGKPPSRRGSVSGPSGPQGQFRASIGASAIPRPQTALRGSRPGSFRASISAQPSFASNLSGDSHIPLSIANLSRSSSRQGRTLTGPSPPPANDDTAASSTNPTRDSSKENIAPPDAAEYEAQRRRIEELKAEVGTLSYQISNYEQEKELARLQMENEMRDIRRHAEEDFKAKQAADAEKSKALRHAESLQAELDVLRAEKETQKRELDAKTREAQEEARLLHEQVEELKAAKEEAARLAEREITELKAKVTLLERTAQEAEEENRTLNGTLEKVNAQLAERDDTIGKLEAEVLRLKAHTGDAETVSVIRRELSDQVNHIRMLESKNREQITELKHLRQVHKAVEVVEEEKRTLQRKLEAAQTLDTELAEERRQRLRLEDERRSWTAYLESNSEGPVEFDSPEAVARALVEERFRSASLTERLGALQPEIADRDNIIKSLEDEKARLLEQIEKLRATSGPTANDKARARLDRQRALAVKEVEYLRAQLKTFDMEDVTMQPEQLDEQKAKRIQELEDLVDKYKEEVNTLHADLTSVESATTSPVQPVLAGAKRPRETDETESEQLGQLARKNRKLQSEFSDLQTAHRILQKEHEVTTSQLAAAKDQLKTRILSLRDNPTSEYEKIKTDTLKALQLENAELLAHLERQPTLFATVPATQIAALKREISAAQAETASAQKRADRLKQVWAAKSAEFKEAVFSTLGWTVTFIPGGKMRVESVYYPSKTEEHENSIVFDGEKGTMKVGGGPRSEFANRIADNIRFWVRERGEVPCFLAALTLEFYEEMNQNGAAKQLQQAAGGGPGSGSGTPMEGVVTGTGTGTA